MQKISLSSKFIKFFNSITKSKKNLANNFKTKKGGVSGVSKWFEENKDHFINSKAEIEIRKSISDGQIFNRPINNNYNGKCANRNKKIKSVKKSSRKFNKPSPIVSNYLQIKMYQPPSLHSYHITYTKEKYHHICVNWWYSRKYKKNVKSQAKQKNLKTYTEGFGRMNFITRKIKQKFKTKYANINEKQQIFHSFSSNLSRYELTSTCSDSDTDTDTDSCNDSEKFTTSASNSEGSESNGSTSTNSMYAYLDINSKDDSNSCMSNS
ncbi:hypothetical protein A3Q56_06601 [Intoshia linei]|uniref:Uncharacterized protein n=1 Tax=Intoshia linei TaxID=1819745 RepID=A0A177AWC8_9BILA|nr:hypothetical protein A3Q56_06601 [Intoshia linei]